MPHRRAAARHITDGGLTSNGGSGGTQPAGALVVTSTTGVPGPTGHQLRASLVGLKAQVSGLGAALRTMKTGCRGLVQESQAVLEQRLRQMLPTATTTAIARSPWHATAPGDESSGGTDEELQAAMAALTADNERLRRRLQKSRLVSAWRPRCLGRACPKGATSVLRVCVQGRKAGADGHGNTIAVYVRVRPLSKDERRMRGSQSPAHAPHSGKVHRDGTDTTRPVSVISATELAFYDARARMWRPFAFDGIFGPAATQQHLFEYAVPRRCQLGAAFLACRDFCAYVSAGALATLREVEALASGAVEGYHGCVLAFGQTGSGKTYSMEGRRSSQGSPIANGGGASAGATATAGVPEPEAAFEHGLDEGLSYRLASHIFRVIAQRQSGRSSDSSAGADSTSGEGGEYVVRVSMVEIYNEQLRDLLAGWPDAATDGTAAGAGGGCDPSGNRRSTGAAGGTPARLHIRQTNAARSHGGSPGDSVHVVGLTQVCVGCVADVRNVLACGNNARAVASTNVHEHSSRSHSIVQIEVCHRSPGEASATTVGRLSLVDLAGSERLRKSHATGDRLVEARHINKSLSALGDVLEALDRKASHVPCVTDALAACVPGR